MKSQKINGKAKSGIEINLTIDKVRNYLILACIGVFTILMAGWAGPSVIRQQASVPAPDRFTSSQLRADFIELLDTIEMVHAAPFNTISRDTLIKLFEERIVAGKENYSLFEAFRLFASLIALLDDGHTGVYVPKIPDSISVLPLLFKKCDNSLVVFKDLTEDSILKGKTVTHINGFPVDSIENTIVQHISGELDFFRQHKAVESISAYLYPVFGFSGPFRINYLEDTGEAEVLIQGLSMQKMNERMIQLFRPIPFDFYVIDSLKTGVLSLRTMSFPKEFKKFMKKTMKEIDSKNVNTIVVNIAGNLGGSDRTSITLLDYVTSIPYAFHDTMLVRMPGPGMNIKKITAKQSDWHRKW